MEMLHHAVNWVFTSRPKNRILTVSCGIGLAWKYAWQADAQLPLYDSDGFHPSVTGSVLAALTIYGALRDKKDFKYLKYNQLSWQSAVSEAKFEVLKQAALKALNK